MLSHTIQFLSVPDWEVTITGFVQVRPPSVDRLTATPMPYVLTKGRVEISQVPWAAS